MIVKRNSLHWRLAHKYGPIDDWQREQNFDLCTYSRAVLRGMVMVAVIVFFGGLAAWGVGDLAAWLAVYAQTRIWIPMDTPASFAATVIIASTIVGSVIYPIVKFKSWKEDREYAKWMEAGQPMPAAKEPSIIALWYKGFKDKVCFNVTIEKREG